MADTFFNWGAGAHATHSAGTPWDDVAIANAGVLTSDEISLDGFAGCEVSIKAIEDNTGACTGNLEIYILRTDNDPDGEGWQDALDKFFVGEIDIEQNTTRRYTFSVDPGRVSSFKVYVINSSGQELAVTVNYITATIPVAS